MTTRPALKVEIAFGIDGNNATAVAAMVSGDWTDITSWVVGAPTVERSKRSTELDRFEAGTMKLTLDNADGRFTPTNTSSPYWPNILPYRMIRVRATSGATTYPVWQGYVERWPVRWADPARGLCEIECVDAMATAAQIGMSGILTAEILADAPTFYYPLTDDSGSDHAANQSTTPQQTAVIFHDTQTPGDSDAYAFGGSIPIIGADSQSGLSLTRTGTSFPDYTGFGLRLPFVTLDWNHGWTIEGWAQFAAGDDGDILVLSGYNDASQIRLRGGGGGQATITITTPDGVNHQGVSSLGLITVDVPHHFAATWRGPAVGTPRAWLFVDGVDLGFVDFSTSTFARTNVVVPQCGSVDTIGIGAVVKTSDTGTGGAGSGTYAHLAIWPGTQLADARITAHYTAGISPLVGQLPGQRATSLFNYADFPLWLDYNGSTVLQAAIDIAGRSLLDCLQDLADTENSEMYATADGKLCLTYRGKRMDQTAPGATFGSNVAAGEIPYTVDALQLDWDPNLVYNDVTVERKNGSSPRVYDAASILSFFDRALSRTSYAASDTDSQAAASWLLDRYRQPQIRSEAITIAAGNLGADVTNLWPQLLALDIGSRVLINHRPMNQPAIPIPGFVDQITHAIDPDAGTWNVTLQVSPLFHEYFALADPTDHTWDVQSTPDANGYIYLSY